MWRGLLTLAVCVICVARTTAEDCTCVGTGSPCDAVWSADAVFVGRVVSVDRSLIGRLTAEGERVELAVLESFRGTQTTRLTLVSGLGKCRYPFKVGESYFVYAYRSPDGALTTSICTRTRSLAHAAADLTYARSLSGIVADAPARFTGSVWLFGDVTKGPLKPAVGVTVTARGAGGTFSAVTDERGQFEVAGLPPGEYEITPQAPYGYYSFGRKFDVSDPRGCGTTTLYLYYDVRVRGRVVDARGAPIRDLPLELVPRTEADKRGNFPIQSWTDPNGLFGFAHVPPGEYVVRFNPIRPFFYPGGFDRDSAALVSVSVGERVILRDFVLPDEIKLVKLNGFLVDEKGQPMPEAVLTLGEEMKGGHMIGRLVTEPDGRFTFTLADGGRYQLHVQRWLRTHGQAFQVHVSRVRFRSSATTPPITLVMNLRQD